MSMVISCGGSLPNGPMPGLALCVAEELLQAVVRGVGPVEGQVHERLVDDHFLFLQLDEADELLGRSGRVADVLGWTFHWVPS
jgi:hypothetical protein